MNINENFAKLGENYIFTELAVKAAEAAAKQNRKIIDLGIGDVCLPIPRIFTEEMSRAAKEQAKAQTFKGYPPTGGYGYLREKISEEYDEAGIDIGEDEIFITDGAKTELGNVAELFTRGVKVLFPTPYYPAGVESNVIAGNDITLLRADKSNGFIPLPPYGDKYDLVYLCSPNNPTGSAFTRRELSEWVNYALSTGAVIVYDGAYSAFASGDYPKTVYEIRGAKNCAIEIRSFSKSLGFTGIRLGYTVVPKDLGELNALYKRRAGARFNGASVISQRGGAVYFTPEGRANAEKRINFYKTNAATLKIALKKKKIWYNNTCCSPYVFAECPDGYDSERFCDLLLDKCGIVSTPARGFLYDGEFFRLSAFRDRESVMEAAERIMDADF